MLQFPIHIPGKQPGKIVVPNDVTGDDMPLIQAVFAYLEAYTKHRKEGGKP
jgi:hypothetical protein